METSCDIKLNRSEKKFQVLFENSPIGMAMVVHATGKFIEVNPSLLKSTGYTREEFLSLNYWDITPKEYEAQELEQIQELNKTGKFGPNFKEYIRKDGTKYPIKISGFKVTDTDGTEVVWGFIEDISERKKFEEELLYLASHDYLTDLANRRSLVKSFNIALNFCNRESKKLAVLTIDLDKFKQINDTYGHHKGDEVLIELSRRMHNQVQRASDIVSRIGGDEFIIVLVDITEKFLYEFAENIVNIIKKEIELEDLTLSLTASIGVSIFPNHANTGEALMKLSDHMAYRVKKEGGNGFKVFSVSKNSEKE